MHLWGVAAAQASSLSSLRFSLMPGAQAPYATWSEERKATKRARQRMYDAKKREAEREARLKQQAEEEERVVLPLCPTCKRWMLRTYCIACR